MANNLIQIKRSNTAASPSPSSNLVAGELAFSYNSNSLFIGAQSGATGTSYKIGGAKYNYVDQAGNPGVQTANAVVILDANSFTTNTYTQGLVIQTSGSVTTPAITAINAVANLTTLGAASNSELTTTWAIKNFVDLKVAQASNPQGSNGQFQYNDDGVLAGTPNFVYNKVTGEISVGNSVSNIQLGYLPSANQLAHFHGNQNTYIQVIMSNANTGNNASADYMLYNDIGVTGNGEVDYLDIGYNGSNYNGADYSATDAGGGYIYTANGSLAIGTKEVASGSIVKFFTGGTTSDKIRAVIDNGGNVGIGNTAPNAKLQVTGTANISGLTTISANLVLGAGIQANGSGGSLGWLLKSGGTGNVYWEAASPVVAGSNTQVQYNDNGSLAGATGFTYNNTTNNVSMGNNLTVSNTVVVGNSTVNSTINSTAIAYDGVVVSNSSVFTGTAYLANSSTYLGGKTEGNLNVNSALTANASTYLNGKLEANLNVNNAVTANNADYLGTVAAANYVQNTDSRTLSGNLTFSGANNVFNGAALNVLGTTLNVSSNVVVSAANITATSAYLKVRDVDISGNLTVTGTLTTIDTNNLQVKDAMIKVADQQTTTDLVDFGIYGSYGNASANYFAGIYRDRGGSTMTDPLFKLFASNTEPTSIVDNTALGYTLGTLNAYLTTGALIANSTVVNITANASVSVALTANSLSLTTALPATSGGTGQNTYTSGDLLVANSGNALSKLALDTNAGYVLQSNGTALVYNTLDGGTF